MNRQELVEKLARSSASLGRTNAEIVARMILEAMADALVSGKKLAIRNFGSFEVRYRRPRIGRNPKTGEVVPVPAKPRIQFTPAGALRKRVAHSYQNN
jgi:integration host factor subunit beta